MNHRAHFAGIKCPSNLNIVSIQLPPLLPCTAAGEIAKARALRLGVHNLEIPRTSLIVEACAFHCAPYVDPHRRRLASLTIPCPCVTRRVSRMCRVFLAQHTGLGEYGHGRQGSCHRSNLFWCGRPCPAPRTGPFRPVSAVCLLGGGSK